MIAIYEKFNNLLRKELDKKPYEFSVDANKTISLEGYDRYIFIRRSGKPLRKIIEELGNKSYSYIEMRCKWKDKDEEYDEFWGCCYYDNTLKKLFPLDGDSYSLDDLYDEWKEYDTDLYENPCLTVWEYGRVED